MMEKYAVVQNQKEKTAAAKAQKDAEHLIEGTNKNERMKSDKKKAR